MFKHRELPRILETRRVLTGLGLLIAAAVALTVTAGTVSAAPPTERDYFGTVVSVGVDVLVIDVDGAIVDIPTNEDTEVRLPLKVDASLTDLVEGDTVAVSLDEEDGLLIADKIFLIPGKTLFRHVPGEVTAETSTQITIQPLEAGATPITFARNATTTVTLQEGESELAVGSFVVIVAVRDQLTGELSLEALEIHVTSKGPEEAEDDISEEEEPAATSTPVNIAEIDGEFQGISTSTGRWIVGGTEVAVDANTRIEDAIAVGQLVEIEAEILPDGSLLALRVEAKEEAQIVSSKTKLEGIFTGVDPQNENIWIISEVSVLVGPGTDTDGLPFVGQHVEVKALLQEDGTLLAREIENESGAEEDDEDVSETKLEGILQNILDGVWTVNGVEFTVATSTRIKGTPTPGGFVKVKAVLVDGALVAFKVEAETGSGGESKKEAELEGTVTAILDADGNSVTSLSEGAGGTITIDGGIQVSVTSLTELDGDLQVDAFVEVEGVFQGALIVATEVEVKSEKEEEEEEEEERNTVEIRGIIDPVSTTTATTTVNSFTVNAGSITVVLDDDTELKGRIQGGAAVKIEGTIQADGSILAEEVKEERPEEEEDLEKVKFRNVTASVSADGTTLTVNGDTIQIDPLTEGREDLEPGTEVLLKKLEALEIGGVLIATEVEVERKDKDEEDEKEDEGDEHEELSFEGVIASITSTATTTKLVLEDGSTFLITDDTERDTLDVGAEVKVEAEEVDGILVATRVTAKGAGDDEEENEGDEQEELSFEGVIASITSTATTTKLVLEDGSTFLITDDTERDTLDVGAEVKVEAEEVDGVLVATTIGAKGAEEGDEEESAEDEDADEEDGNGDGEGGHNGEDECNGEDGHNGEDECNGEDESD